MHSDPLIKFDLFGNHLQITLYGIFLALGLIVCLLVLKFYTDYRKIDRDVQDFGFITAILAIIIGFVFAALFQALYNYIETGVWQFGAITAMGGFVGGTVAFIAIYFGVGHYLFKGKKKDIHIKDFNKILLAAPCCITIAHAFGRIGCLMAGCCHGDKVAAGQGGIWMNGTYGYGYYIPTQLYESLFLFVLFGILSYMYFKRINLTHVVYLIAYGIWRFIIEFFRSDDRGEIFKGASISPSQVMSILFVLGGIALFVYFYVKKIPLKLPPDEDIKNAEVSDAENNEKPI